MRSEVFLYIPNIIGYFRIVLLLTAWGFLNYPQIFLPCYLWFVILDGLDGYAARYLGQVSEFGAWLDVAIDNLGRGMLWSALFQGGCFISALEWCVFVCTHSSMGAEWKSRFVSSPWWVHRVMANAGAQCLSDLIRSFKTTLGVFVIAGLHLLPVWLYSFFTGVLTDPLHLPRILQWVGIVVLSAGRLWCLAIEIWCIWTHIKFLTR